MSEFEGIVAIASGASSGMGEATARRLAREGALVVLLAAPHDRGALARVQAELGDRAVAVAGDIADPATSRQAVRTLGLELAPYGIRVDRSAKTARDP